MSAQVLVCQGCSQCLWSFVLCFGRGTRFKQKLWSILLFREQLVVFCFATNYKNRNFGQEAETVFYSETKAKPHFLSKICLDEEKTASLFYQNLSQQSRKTERKWQSTWGMLWPWDGVRVKGQGSGSQVKTWHLIHPGLAIGKEPQMRG